jgi:hypothetical protein
MDLVAKESSSVCARHQTRWSASQSDFVTTIQESLIPIVMKVIPKVVCSVVLQTL